MFMITIKVRYMILFFLLFLGIVALQANPRTTPTVLAPQKNLVSPYYFTPQLSYTSAKTMWCRWLGREFTIKDGTFEMSCKPGQKAKRPTLIFDYSTMLTDKLRISFDYDLKGSGTVYLSQNKFAIAEGSGKTFTHDVNVKVLSSHGSVSFDCEGELKVKNLVVTAIKPSTKEGKKLLINGKHVRGIYYKQTNLKQTFFDYRAACMLQKYLFLAGGEVLPIRDLSKSVDSISAHQGAFVIGQAAKKYIKPSILNKVRPGGYALNIDHDVAAIYGAKPSGAPGGVFALLKKIGFFYLTNKEFIKPEKPVFTLDSACVVENPAIPMRLDTWPAGASVGMGMSDSITYARFNALGRAATCHSIPYFISWKEFKDSDPEFFALQADGVRRPSKRGDVHYCLTNTKLQDLLAARVNEFLDAEPICEYLHFAAGDGMTYACRCDKCKKLGAPTDRTIFFINKIAEKIKDKHPDVKLTMLAYTDTRQAPIAEIPDPNVVVLYCPYGPVWNNHLQTNHKDNSVGWSQLKDWVKACPDNMGAFVYPSCCPERLNVWPSFYANYKKFKFFAKHNFRVINYCGLRPWDGGVPASGIFNPVQRYVLTRVLWDPDLDVEKEIDTFFKLYYGDAAPAFRQLFNLLHEEVIKRDWSQNTEKVIRGFMTSELMDKCITLFNKAANAVKEKQPYEDRVAKEKIYLLWSYLSDINRANGKLKPIDFGKYAKRLAEFCELGKRFRVMNLGRFTVKQWFWNSTMIDLSGKGCWYDEPIIKKLVADPAKTLGENIPKAQVKKPYGLLIPAKGMFGGRSLNSSWLRSKVGAVKQLWRPSSGQGMTQLLVTLDQQPGKDVTIKLNGIDNEKEGVAQMRMLVNGEMVYEGKVPWEKDSWSFKSFTVPAKYWKPGDNLIQLLNTTPDKDVFSQGRKVSRNYYWGWYIIDECQLHF
jgi:hypothetical protein